MKLIALGNGQYEESRMTDLGDPVERIKSLQEWAVKQASKYDRKYAKYNDARAWVMAQRYDLVVELCDRVLLVPTRRAE